MTPITRSYLTIRASPAKMEEARKNLEGGKIELCEERSHNRFWVVVSHPEMHNQFGLQVRTLPALRRHLLKLKKEHEIAKKQEMAKAKKEAQECATRPENYTPQQGHKAILSLADFTDDEIIAELRRRTYNGELRYTKVLMV